MTKKYFIRIFILVLVAIVLMGVVMFLSIDNSSKEQNSNITLLKWIKINDEPNFSLAEADTFRDGVIFQWNSNTYEASNTTPKTQNPTLKGEYFKLLENGVSALSLDEAENEMRLFQFSDCQSLLCIWGLHIHNPVDNSYAPTPPIDLHLVLMPDKKEYSFNNPCRVTGQINNYSIEKLDSNVLMIEVKCGTYSSSEKNEYYQTVIDIDKI